MVPYFVLSYLQVRWKESDFPCATHVYRSLYYLPLGLKGSLLHHTASPSQRYEYPIIHLSSLFQPGRAQHFRGSWLLCLCSSRQLSLCLLLQTRRLEMPILPSSPSFSQVLPFYLVSFFFSSEMLTKSLAAVISAKVSFTSLTSLFFVFSLLFFLLQKFPFGEEYFRLQSHFPLDLFLFFSSVLTFQILFFISNADLHVECREEDGEVLVQIVEPPSILTPTFCHHFNIYFLQSKFSKEFENETLHHPPKRQSPSPHHHHHNRTHGRKVGMQNNLNCKICFRTYKRPELVINLQRSKITSPIIAITTTAPTKNDNNNNFVCYL